MAKAEKKTVNAADLVARKAEIVGVTAESLRHGDYRIADVRLDDGELASTHRTLVNRGGTAIERWLNNDPAGLFDEGARRAIEFCKGMWQKIDKKGPKPIPVHGTGYLWLGQSEHEAGAEMALIKDEFPLKFWTVFENVCRFDVDAAGAGFDLATNNRSATDASKICVAMIACKIAELKGL